jgi:hypothetical protein
MLLNQAFAQSLPKKKAGLIVQQRPVANVSLLAFGVTCH